MNTYFLNTEDQRCPNVMIMVRRFLNENIKPQAVCSIVTREPSAMRDIPYFCEYQGMKLISKQEINGEFHFSIGHQNSIIETVVVQSQPVETFDIHRYKRERDVFLHARFRKIVEAQKMLLDDGYLVTIPCSFGKDSNLVLTAALTAHIEAMIDPNSPVTKDTPMIVIHIDTAVESIPMTMYSQYAMDALRTYCQANEINLELHHVKPALHEQFASLFLGARKLPSTPSLNADCSVIWKVMSSEKIQKELINKYGVSKLVSCLGSRDDEGAARSASITKFDNRISVETLIKRNDGGINTFAPIVDWSTADVFDCLLRAGEQASIVPMDGYAIPAFMPSYRLLIQIYGDSALDVCEVTLGSHKTNSAGCGGKSRNGCHQCFKVGKTDKSATAHNQHLRWSTIQENATKVRDYVFSIAHDINHRTMHPRTFDPVTNHAMLQPNIIKSSTLEKMLAYYIQLTHFDYLRSLTFRRLVDAGLEMEDPGYSEIANDSSMDEVTKSEFLVMYKHSAQQHLIKVATLEHCIFLSAQWAMDGVKSLPFRPLAIYHSIVNEGKYIPWPTVDKSNIKNDTIPDAVAFKLATPGIDMMSLWKAPHRPWDIFDADHNEGCFTESMPESIRASVTYSAQTKDVNVSFAGRSLNVGHNVKAQLVAAGRTRIGDSDQVTFTQFLTGRSGIEIGNIYAEQPRAAKKHAHSTMRKVLRHKKTGKITRTRTSLQMYNPSWKSSLSESFVSKLNIWVPSFTQTSVPIISQHQKNLALSEPNFSIDEAALLDWKQSGGMQEALRIHDEHFGRLRRSHNKIGSRHSLRMFCGTHAFWALFQTGLISVNHNTWYTCQSTLKRTELFHEIGLYDFVDADDYHSVANHAKCQTMHMHRQIKAKQLLVIRQSRNDDRKNAKALLAEQKTHPVQFTVNTIKSMLDELCDIRDRVITGDFVSNVMISASGISAFDHLDFKRMSEVQQDWLFEYGQSLLHIDTFIDQFCTQEQKRFLISNIPSRILLANHIKAKGKKFIATLAAQHRQWTTLLNTLSTYRNESAQRKLTPKEQLQSIIEITDTLSDGLAHMAFASHVIAHIQTGNKQSMSTLLREGSETLSIAWHQNHWEKANSSIKALALQLQSITQTIEKDIDLDKTTALARSKSLMSLLDLAA